MKEYFQRREDERKEMRKLVESTMQGHQNTKEAKVKLQKMKQKIGKLSKVVPKWLLLTVYEIINLYYSSANREREARDV